MAAPAGPPGGPPGPAIEVDEQRAEDFASLFRLDGRRVILVGGYGGIGEVTTRLFADYGATSSSRADPRRRPARSRRSCPAMGAVRWACAWISRIAKAPARWSRAASRSSAASTSWSTLPASTSRLLPRSSGGSVAQRGRRESLGRLLAVAGGGPGDDRRGSRRPDHPLLNHPQRRRRTQGFAAYAASKAGLNGLIRQLATEWGKHRITVNGIAPGFVPTDLVQDAASNERFMAMMLGRIPFGRFGDPLELAGPPCSWRRRRPASSRAR